MNNPFTTCDVTIKSTFDLKGTLYTPAVESNRLPAILLVAGSGQVDRLGNAQGFKQKLNLYKELIEFFVAQGFATLCYDKRGVGQSGGDYMRTGMYDLVDDLGACVEYLKHQPKVDPERIIVVGHSEGSMLTTVYAARHCVAGVILLAGANETLDEATARQRQLAYRELLQQKGFSGFLFRLLKIDIRGEKQAQALLDKMLKTDQDVIKVQFKPMNAKWYREHHNHDVKADLASITFPVLAITGTTDLQADAERLKSLSQPNITWSIIDNMNHALREELNPSIAKFKESYIACASKPLHQELTKQLGSWLAQFSR